MSKFKEIDTDDSNSSIEIAEKQRDIDIVNGCEEKLFEKADNRIVRKYYWNPKIKEVVVVDEFAVETRDGDIDWDFEVVGTLTTINQLVQATK